MLGMIGIIVVNGEIKNTTQITKELIPGEKYLVRFLNNPSFNRVSTIEEIQQWVLFNSQEDANKWVQALAQKPDASPKDPEDDDKGDTA